MLRWICSLAGFCETVRAFGLNEARRRVERNHDKLAGFVFCRLNRFAMSSQHSSETYREDRGLNTSPRRLLQGRLLPFPRQPGRLAAYASQSTVLFFREEEYAFFLCCKELGWTAELLPFS